MDSMGPALKVLNQQHRALMTMLTQLDKLGAVGTRVLNASTDNIVASLRHLQPVLTKLSDAGDSLPDGLSMLASFPFPKEAADIARGDYANALFHLDLDLGKLVKSPGDVLPNLINLCGATPAASLCQGLSGPLKATVCKALEQEPGNLPNIGAVLCPPGSTTAKGNPLPLPDLGILGGCSGSGANGSGSGGSSGGGSGGGLGGLLGGHQ